MKKIKKNIFDLNFQKYLISASTSIIVAFTYLIGISIAFLTKQIPLDDISARIIVLIFTGAMLSLCGFVFFRSRKRMNTIIDSIKELNF